MPILKSLCTSRAERAALAADGEVIESYPAFVVMQVADAAVRKFSRRHPVEDISDQYRLPLGGSEVDPLSVKSAHGARPLVPRRGAAPDDAAHHYLVQFIGPVKKAWINAAEGAQVPCLRHPTGGFGYVVCADATVLDRIRALACVRWAGHLPHADRVAPVHHGKRGLAELPRRRSLAGALTVDLFDAADLPRMAEEAAGAGLHGGGDRPAGHGVISLQAQGTACPGAPAGAGPIGRARCALDRRTRAAAHQQQRRGRRHRPGFCGAGGRPVWGSPARARPWRSATPGWTPVTRPISTPTLPGAWSPCAATPSRPTGRRGC
jgi:hypothetical protein